MTLTAALSIGSSNLNMESFRATDTFWDEVRNMIDELDIAFDEELITLKEKECELEEPSTELNASAASSSDVSQNQRTKLIPESATSPSKDDMENISDDCEIVGISKINVKEKKHRSESSSSSSSSSSDSSTHKSHKKKHKKDKKRRKDKKKSKKKHKHRSSSRSRSSSLEKMENILKKRLREAELLDKIEQLEAEKKRRLMSLSPDDYEPFKINMPDLSYKPVDSSKSSSSKNIKITESGFILESRSKSKSFEPFVDGPVELLIPKEMPSESKKWTRRDMRRESPEKKRRKSPILRRNSRSPSYTGRRRSISPYRRRRSSRDSRSPRRRETKREISPSRRKRLGTFGRSPIRGDRRDRSRSLSLQSRLERSFRKPNKDRSPSSSTTSNASSSAAKKDRPRDRPSRWSNKSPKDAITDIIKSNKATPVHPVPMKPESDEENWDNLLMDFPKTKPAGYDLEEIKAAPQQLFKFLDDKDDDPSAATEPIVIKDVAKKDDGFGNKNRRGKKGGKANRIIRIDDDEDIIMVQKGQHVSKWDKKFSTYRNQKYKNKQSNNKLPLYTPESLTTVLDLPKKKEQVPVVNIAKKEACEEGEITSEIDEPLPPGVEPDEFKNTIVSVPEKSEDPPEIPAPIPKNSDILLPPGVDATEDDVDSTIIPLTKKISDAKKLREMYECMPPGCEEDDFVPPPQIFFRRTWMENIKESKKPVEVKPLEEFVEPPKGFFTNTYVANSEKVESKKVLKDKSKPKTPNIAEENDSELTPPGCSEISLGMSKTIKRVVREDYDSISDETLSDTPVQSKHLESISTDSPAVEETSTELSPTPTEDPIPDLDPSKLLSDSLIKENQEQDPIYSRIKECLEKDEPPPGDIRYLMEEYKPMGITTSGLLYREKFDQYLTIIPESLIERIIISLHVIDENRHLNEEMTEQRISERYFWPFMSDTIHDFIKNCSHCSKS